ncbi:MAG: hypothetical protein JWM31_3511 [Solirubrobacterales bacterium]|nr:hypothetical protein [Solirubrobacterales bacterium]
MQRVLPICLALTTAALATAALADAQSGGATTRSTSTGTTTAPPASENPGQDFFHDALIKDARTLSAIRKALSSGADVVDPATQYADLTGDGKQDAIVRVHSTGAAGVVAAFVFSTDGAPKGDLRVLFRSQSLYRAVTMVADGEQLQIDEPLFAAGDELCCPSRLTRRRYRFSKNSRQFARTSRERITLR